LYNVNNLRNLTRYQAAPRVSSESVAEHSFFVAAYVLKLYDYYDFNLEKALRMALLHDFNEVFVSDVPFPIKSKYKALNKELEKAEYEVNCEHISKEFANEMKEFNEMTSAEGIIVEVGDVLSVVSYSKHEIELGNSSYMRDVYNRSIPRYTRILTKAEKYIREGYTTEGVIAEIENFMSL
jgi:putative hydrolase of HD superfamily